MPLTSTQKNHYIELTNGILDRISMDNVPAFAIMMTALRDVLQPNSDQAIPEGLELTELKEHLEALKEFLNNPGRHVENSENYTEFQNIVREQITAKINIFSLQIKRIMNEKSVFSCYYVISNRRMQQKA